MTMRKRRRLAARRPWKRFGRITFWGESLIKRLEWPRPVPLEILLRPDYPTMRDAAEAINPGGVTIFIGEPADLPEDARIMQDNVLREVQDRFPDAERKTYPSGDLMRELERKTEDIRRRLDEDRESMPPLERKMLETVEQEMVNHMLYGTPRKGKP